MTSRSKSARAFRVLRLPLLTFALLALFTSTAPAGAADIAGHWVGTIQVPGQTLDFDVDLRSEGGSLAGDISIPMQGAKDIPLEKLSLEGDQLSFAIAGIPGAPTFTGAVSGSEVRGKLKQGGGAFDFEMKKADVVAAAHQETLQELGPVIKQALADFGIPGLAVAAVVGGETVWSAGFGFRDVEAKKPVDADTLFAIGSTSKAFTAFILGTLVDEGKLKWNQRLIDVLPDFRLYDEATTQHMQVQDLLFHSSGLPRHDLAWYNSPASREELYKRLRYLEPTKDLRETFQYQNLMFMTAGYLAERVTGKKWEELVRERIFAPLGMTRSNFSVLASQRDDDFAFPYNVEDRAATKIPFRDITTVGPAGSINSSVGEMTQWIKLQLGGGELGGKRLIETATLRAMHTPHIVAGGYPTEQTTLSLGYGYGWALEAHRGHYLVQHGGGIDGFISWVALLPLDNIGVVVYTNAAGLNPLPTAVARLAIDRLLGLDPIDYLAKAKQQLAEATKAQAEAEKNKEVKRVAGTKPSKGLASFAGEYSHPGYGTITVAVDGKDLSLTYNNIVAHLEHWHYDTWNAKKTDGADPTFADSKFQFRLDSSGEVVDLLAPFEPALEPIAFDKRADKSLSDPAFLGRLTGEYELATQRAKVSLAGNRLQASLPGQPTYALEPKRGTEFSIEGLSGFSVEFLLGPSGPATSVRFIQPNGIFEGKRVE